MCVCFCNMQQPRHAFVCSYRQVGIFCTGLPGPINWPAYLVCGVSPCNCSRIDRSDFHLSLLQVCLLSLSLTFSAAMIHRLSTHDNETATTHAYETTGLIIPNFLTFSSIFKWATLPHDSYSSSPRQLSPPMKQLSLYNLHLLLKSYSSTSHCRSNQCNCSLI